MLSLVICPSKASPSTMEATVSAFSFSGKTERDRLSLEFPRNRHEGKCEATNKPSYNTLCKNSLYITPLPLPLSPSLSYPCVTAMSLPSPPPSHDYDRPDLESIRVVVVSVNNFIRQFLADGACSWNSVKSACISMLQAQKHEFFEFSEHSVLSNLYWGIDNIEAAIRAEWPGERESRLRSSEGMLQVPALLDEEDMTSGIVNCHLIAISYFYLCVVKRLQGEDWQVAVHFLQALSVCPELVRNVFAPQLCKLLFLSGSSWSKSKKTGGHGSSGPVRLMDSNEEEALEPMKQMAKKFKGWLMYYQVMLYGETPQWNCGSREVLSLQNDTNCLM